MTFDADSLAERRRLKRRLSYWRILAILAVVAVIVAAAAPQGGYLAKMFPQDQIARVSIEGFITDSRKRTQLYAKLADAKHVKGVIVFINSPGGTTAGGETLYDSLRSIAEKKPTVAVFGTGATSAAYLAGIAADHIVAHGNSITGSVGVIFQWAEFSELAKTLGVHVEEVRSGPLKAVPSLMAPIDPAGRQLVEGLVNESRDWFVKIVQQRRKLTDDVLTDVKTGRIYSGRQALAAGLIDGIGDEAAARNWLQEKRGVPKKLKVVDWKVKQKGWLSVRGVAETSGTFFGALLERAGQSLIKDAALINLDGLTSVWHPQKQQ